MHHPPIPVPMLRAAEIIELLDQHQLAAVVEGTDVRAIVGGHFHFSTYSTFAGVPVSVASASCYTSDPAPVERFVSGVDGHQAITMMHVYPDRIVHTIVPLAEAPEVSGYPTDVVAQLETLTAEQRREEISRKDSAFNTFPRHHPVQHGSALQPDDQAHQHEQHAGSSRAPCAGWSLSSPAIPTAAAAIARFCGLIIFPSTPPEEFAAASSNGSSPAFVAVCTCRAPKSALDDVSDPVTATPSQPRIGDSSSEETAGLGQPARPGSPSAPTGS